LLTRTLERIQPDFAVIGFSLPVPGGRTAPGVSSESGEVRLRGGQQSPDEDWLRHAAADIRILDSAACPIRFW
jgi:hypothetical protein